MDYDTNSDILSKKFIRKSKIQQMNLRKAFN